MLDLRFISENISNIKNMLGARKQSLDVDRFLMMENERRNILKQVEELRHKRNFVSGEIAKGKKQGIDVNLQIGEMKGVSSIIKDLDANLRKIENGVRDFQMIVPNMFHESVPIGNSEEDNTLVKTWGMPREFDFPPKYHWEIGELSGILDFERSAKITGSRFVIYKGNGARLERALINFMLDIHTSIHGYTEMLPPFIVNEISMTGTGQLPKFKEDLFKLEGHDYFLIPTAEVPVTNYFQDEILEESALPVKFTAYTPCFRSEAGSYGKDTRGLMRQHQFNKVEMVKFSHPETSYDELESLLMDAEEILQKLGLPYRVVTLCSADIGFSAAKTYDIEVWVPGQNKYREISSCSNFEDFQARRAIYVSEEMESRKQSLYIL